MRTTEYDWCGNEPSAFQRALGAIVVERHALGREEDVPLDLVFGGPWHPDRLERWRERLAAGEEPPVVRAVRLCLPAYGAPWWLGRAGCWYAPLDDWHCLTAAREAGRRTARLEIEEAQLCDPDAFCIHDGGLWRPYRAPGRLRAAHVPLPADLMAELRKLGVRDWTPDLVSTHPADDDAAA